MLATDLEGPHTEHVKKNASVNATRIASERQQAIQEGTEVQQPAAGQEGRDLSVLSRRRRRDRLRTIELKSESLHVAPLDW